MAKHLVKCAICGEQFDTNLIQAVRHGARRYAHYSCYPTGELVPLGPDADPELQKLKNYINDLFGDKTNWALVNKQIKTYQDENGYSLSGILKSLVYFYEIKGNPKDSTKGNGGIGIVPFCYNDAYQYYYNLFIAQEMNKNKTLVNKIKEIFIKPPQYRGTKQQFFNLGDFDNDDEEQ